MIGIIKLSRNLSIKVKFKSTTQATSIKEKDIRDGTSNAIYWYVKANDKYMKDYHKEKLSYLMYCDMSNLYRWEIRGLKIRLERTKVW